MDPSYTNPSSPAPSPAPIISSGVPAPSPVTPQKSKKPLVIILIMLLLVIIGFIVYFAFLNTKSSDSRQSANNAYIEYFIYGTENSTNSITEETLNTPVEEYAASVFDAQYYETLAQKFESTNFGSSQGKTYQKNLLDFYIESSKVLYTGQTDNHYDSPSEDSLIETSYTIINLYINDASESNYRLLRRQNQLAYEILANSLKNLYQEENEK